MKDDAIRLLKLMGFPVLEAQSEAEAQCVQLLKEGKIHAVVSDDMDCLTFGCELLIKGVRTKNDPISEVNLSVALEGLGLSFKEFVDFCILCGCDYCDSIENMGPVKAFTFIKEHKTIERVLEVIDEENKVHQAEKNRLKYILPSAANFDYVTARSLFKNPDVFHNVKDVR